MTAAGGVQRYTFAFYQRNERLRISCPAVMTISRGRLHACKQTVRASFRLPACWSEAVLNHRDPHSALFESFGIRLNSQEHNLVVEKAQTVARSNSTRG